MGAWWVWGRREVEERGGLQGRGGRGRLLFLFCFFFLHLEDSEKIKNNFFCHVAQMWQSRQHLTDQWMKNVTDVLF